MYAKAFPSRACTDVYCLRGSVKYAYEKEFRKVTYDGANNKSPANKTMSAYSTSVGFNFSYRFKTLILSIKCSESLFKKNLTLEKLKLMK